ncbi:hypothetical protein EMCRGX_G002800 [Ephydatia muelleri]
MLTIHPSNVRTKKPFKVMQAGDKIFTTDRGGQREFISVDRPTSRHLAIRGPWLKGCWTTPLSVATPHPRGKWRQPSKARWYTEEDEPAGQDGTQNEDEPAGQDGTQNEDEPAGQDGTQDEDEPAGQDGTQSKDEPAGQDGTQNEDELQ